MVTRQCVRAQRHPLDRRRSRQAEPYGWASWTPEKGMIVLRNPSDHAQNFTIEIGKAFELPLHAPLSYRAHSPWAAEARRHSLPICARAGAQVCCSRLRW